MGSHRGVTQGVGSHRGVTWLVRPSLPIPKGVRSAVLKTGMALEGSEMSA